MVGGIDVGVVVVMYDSAPHLPSLVASLGAGLTGVTTQLIAVDNNSTDESVDLAAELDLHVLRLSKNAGYAAAINAGIRALPQTRAVLVLNPDLEVAPGAVAAMMEVLDHDPEVGVVVPQTRCSDGRLMFNQRRRPSVGRAVGSALLGGMSWRFACCSEYVAQPEAYLNQTDIDWGVGAALLISRACIDAVGDWDETFFLYAEELDYCERTRRAGFRIRYTPHAVVTHDGGGGAHVPRYRAMMTVNRVRQYSRHHSRRASWAYFSAVAANEVLRGALLGDEAAMAGATALLRPSSRPPEISCSESLLPF